MKRALLISNQTTDDSGGRAGDLDTRESILRKYGWEQRIGQVQEPYFRSFLPSIVRCYRQGCRENVDLVVSLSNPFHLQLVGLIVSLLLGCPWVVEFRDPMVTNPDREPNALLTKVAKFVEWLCVHFSDRVIWTDGMQAGMEYYRTTYPDVDPEKFVELPFKGYEQGNFQGVDGREYEEFTITYAGSFYEGWIEPHAFLDGMGQYLGDGGDPLTAQFYGDWDAEYDETARTAGVTDHLKQFDFVPHEELVPALKGSDAALYVGGTDPENRENVPSKIWDYIGARVPILAVVDPSFRVGELIEEYGLGLVADPRNPDGIASAIATLQSGEFKYAPDPAVFSRFERETKIEAMAATFDEAVTEAGE